MSDSENYILDKSVANRAAEKINGSELNDRGYKKVDNFRKLILISSAIKNGDKSYSSISEEILIKHGIYIDASECAELSSRYDFLMKRRHGVDITLAIVTYILIFYAGALNTWIGIVSAVLLFPLILNFYSALVVNAKLLHFSPSQLLPTIDDSSSCLSAAIVIASRNEPFLVAKMTFDSALALTYPDFKKEIIVVDNSDTHFPEYLLWKNYVESYSENGSNKVDGIKVVFIHRDGVEGYKPRNLDLAIEAVTSDLIMYLDVDSTISPDTLLRTTSIFKLDSKIGFVQLYTVPTNVNSRSPLAFVQSLRNYFLRLEMVFLTHGSHSLFFGHNAIWRASTVRELGSCLEYHRGDVVVTEDLSMSFRARFKGYYGVGAWVESGEWVPESLRETEAMWLRWTFGTYQVYAKHFTQLKTLRNFKRSELLGWIQNLGYSINYGLVPVYAVLGLWMNSSLIMLLLVMSLLPEITQMLFAYKKLSLGGMSSGKKIVKCYEAFFVLGTFVNWVRFMGLMRYAFGVKQGWVPTGKSSESAIPVSQVIKDRFAFLAFGLTCFTYSVLVLANNSFPVWNTLLIGVVGFYGFNSLLCILKFGRSRMQDELVDVVEKHQIRSIRGFF